MGTFYFFCVLLVGQVFDLSEAVPNYFDDADFQRHIIYFGPKSTLGPKPAGPRITGKSLANGCRTKPVENFALLGTARACPAKKPIKLTKALKMGKHLCASDWHVCTITDKAVQKLSWKTTKMPRGCFAFIYGNKNKAAGYGNHCQANHYFDGILCCPAAGTKSAHHLQTAPPYINGKHADHRFNAIE